MTQSTIPRHLRLQLPAGFLDRRSSGRLLRAALDRVHASFRNASIDIDADLLRDGILDESIAHGRSLGLEMIACFASTVPLDAIERLKPWGITGVEIPIDGLDAATHGRHHGRGSFARNLRMLRLAHDAGLHTTMLTHVGRCNRAQIQALALLPSWLAIDLWAVAFAEPDHIRVADIPLADDERLAACAEIAETISGRDRAFAIEIRCTRPLLVPTGEVATPPIERGDAWRLDPSATPPLRPQPEPARDCVGGRAACPLRHLPCSDGCAATARSNR